jgi:phytol kinase
MTADLVLAGGWLAVLAAGVAACVIVRALGLAATHVRDLLHVGAGVWVLGWPWWHGAAVPIAIVAVVAIATAVLPVIAVHNRIAARIVRSVTGGDERWGGLVYYTAAYAAMTVIARVSDPFPAAAGLLALSLGDGLGGFAGRAIGRSYFQAPGGKRKSFEGSAVVAIAATAGALVAAALFGRDLSFGAAAVLGTLAAVVEALSPRGTDNLFVPAAVWFAAT